MRPIVDGGERCSRRSSDAALCNIVTNQRDRGARGFAVTDDGDEEMQPPGQFTGWFGVSSLFLNGKFQPPAVAA